MKVVMFTHTTTTVKAYKLPQNLCKPTTQDLYQESISGLLHDTISKLSKITGLTEEESIDFLHAQLTEGKKR
jgi:hypothetical protein